jgi:hypothetical protein
LSNHREISPAFSKIVTNDNLRVHLNGRATSESQRAAKPLEFQGFFHFMPHPPHPSADRKTGVNSSVVEALRQKLGSGFADPGVEVVNGATLTVVDPADRFASGPMGSVSGVRPGGGNSDRKMMTGLNGGESPLGPLVTVAQAMKWECVSRAGFRVG